jgi:hypothetical protein
MHDPDLNDVPTSKHVRPDDSSKLVYEFRG